MRERVCDILFTTVSYSFQAAGAVFLGVMICGALVTTTDTSDKVESVIESMSHGVSYYEAEKYTK